MEHVEHPFPPVYSAESHILILGSFPSVKSREDGFFYGHPRNRFWPMLAAVYAEPVPTSIPDKKALLLRHRLALWDVIASCQIEGSSDASVRNAVPVDIARITRSADIHRVLCNGALAGKLYRQHLQPLLAIEPLILPSTSPANATCHFEQLCTIWQAALTQEV